MALKSERERFADAIHIDVYLRRNLGGIGSGVLQELTTR
jgi:hypothetical protein